MTTIGWTCTEDDPTNVYTQVFATAERGVSGVRSTSGCHRDK